MPRIKSKTDCLKLLFRELHNFEPPRSREEAHALISNTLDKIEDKYSGVRKTFENGDQRMYFWSLDIEEWSSLSGDPASLKLRSDHTAHLYNDGTIKIVRHAGGNDENIFLLKGRG